MRKMKIAMSVGAILFVLSSCGRIENPEDDTKVESGIEKIVESDEEPQAAQNTGTAGDSEDQISSDNGDSAAHAAGGEKAETGKENVPEIPVGEYEYVSDGGIGRLVIEKISGGYDISDYESEYSYRFLADSSNIQAVEDNKIYIKYPEQVYADDTADFSYYTLEYNTDEINVYYRKSPREEAEFLYCAKKKQPDGAKQAEKKEVSDGAPNESVAGQAGNAAFQPSLSDEIAAEISYAEEREKEITEKQKAADTQMDMNITAAEMYQMWDDTLNIVWGLLEANLNEVDMEVLRKEEKEWIAFKDAEVQAAGQECEGGSIQPSEEATRAADLTKARVYELAEYAK